MGSLLIFIGICVAFGAIPALITYFVKRATESDELLFTSSPSASAPPIELPSSQEPEKVPAHYTSSERPIYLGMLVVGLIMVFSGLLLIVLHLMDVLGHLICIAGEFIVLIASAFTWSFSCKSTPESNLGLSLFLVGLAISLFAAIRFHMLENKS
ncbi:MAG TPA: hypothetical protein PKK51_01745 [Rhodocyclaceae bacterium]|jgi:hypothetical protein|nr:hypothetical protein [Rhodocyclaceae bacterium]